MIVAKYGNKEYKLLNSVSINKSSRETTFNDIELDFENGTIADLPIYMQEVTIYDENKKIFCGFVESIKCPELRQSNINNKTLNLTLMSPRKATTKRILTISTTDTIQNILNSILNPLYEDGFILKEINIIEQSLTVKFIGKTIEECLNLLSNKYSFWWNIDENKYIYINSIDYQFNKNPILEINENNYTDKIKGLIKITPEIEGTDYANIINVKNARIFYDYSLTNQSIVLKKGDTYNFENPIDVSYDTAKRIKSSTFLTGSSSTVSHLIIECSDSTEAYAISGINTTGEIVEGMNYQNMSKNDDDNQLFTLQMDSTFENLANGIKYNGTNNITITAITTETAIRYSVVKLINWKQVNELAGIISTSGQIEKVIDVNSKWFTIREIINYIRNLFTTNDKSTNKVTVYYDKENNIKIGDKITFNLSNYLISGNFVVTDINMSKSNNEDFDYIVQLRNTNLLENYIDLFKSTETEENESQTNTEYLIEYAEEETIVENHSIFGDEVETNAN